MLNKLIGSEKMAFINTDKFQHSVTTIIPYATLTLALTIGTPSTLLANEVTIVDVSVSCKTSCNFSVTLKHDDTGWDHYANRWEILDLQGNVIATRVLHHPHVNEQPFKRSLSNVKIPDGTKKVIIRAHDSVHKYSDKTFEVSLPSK